MRFHSLTSYYDTITGLMTPECRFKQALIRQARVESEHRVLDLGSSTGTLAIWIKQQHPQAEVTGVDCDPAILALATEKARLTGQSRSCSVPFRLTEVARLLVHL